MSTIVIIIAAVINVILGLSIVHINRKLKFYHEMNNITYSEIYKLRENQIESLQAELNQLRARKNLKQQFQEELNRNKDLDDQISVQLDLFKDYIEKVREQLEFLDKAMGK